MTYSLRVFAEVLSIKNYFESPRKQLSYQREQSLNQPLLHLSPLETLRRVSGRLRRLFHVREKAAPALRRLLVIDDEETICFSMADYFSQHGFSVETASDIEQAESMIKSGNYEVIIQDLRLGNTKNPNGLKMIRLAHECSPEARIVVLTAYGSSEFETAAKASGADAFLRKPQPLSQVAQVVRGLIESPRRWVTPRA
jgi:ActR/RegA family two-component response regulator